jgi:hypothetical protein
VQYGYIAISLDSPLINSQRMMQDSRPPELSSCPAL